MRIISGKYRGRRLKTLAGANTRPTADKVKESLFNMIGPFFDGGVAFDPYGGSGNLALEAVSRGMEHALIADQNFAAVKVIQENVALTKEAERFTVWKAPAKKTFLRAAAEKMSFDLVFLDPPYAKQAMLAEVQQLQDLNLLNPFCLVVCETDETVDLPTTIGGCHLYKTQTYSATKLTIYQMEETHD